jgi:hypothetical protein
MWRKRLVYALHEVYEKLPDIINYIYEDLRGKIEDMVGEEIPKEKQLDNFSQWHKELKNGKYIEKCLECPNYHYILQILSLLKLKDK